MSLYLVNLDERTRHFMLEELEYDLERNQLYIDPFLSGQGVHDYPQLLREAIANGDEITLAADLRERRRLERTLNRRKPSGGYTIVTVPHTAAETIAESEFNRYYIRGLCRRAIAEGIPELVIYRAKPVENPRSRSEELIESTINPAALLEDLRSHVGVGEEPKLGVPGGPNSGLSVRLP